MSQDFFNKYLPEVEHELKNTTRPWIKNGKLETWILRCEAVIRRFMKGTKITDPKTFTGFMTREALNDRQVIFCSDNYQTLNEFLRLYWPSEWAGMDNNHIVYNGRQCTINNHSIVGSLYTFPDMENIYLFIETN
jgi:hypothetical protein